MASCQVDADCNGTTVCFINVPWLLEQGIESKCSCGCWNGYIGDDCLQLGPGAIYLAASAGIQGFLALVGMIIAIVVFKRKRKQEAGLRMSQMMITTITIIIAMFGVIGWRACSIIRATIPEWNDYFTTENQNPDRKDHRIRPYLAVFVTVSYAFFILAFFNVSLSWVEVASRVLTLSVSGQKSVRKYQLLIFGVEILCGIITVVAYLIFRSTALLFFCISPVMIGGALSYIYGQARIIPLMKRVVVENDRDTISKYGSVIYRVRVTTAILVASAMGMLGAGCAYGYLQFFPEGGWRATSPDGQIAPVTILNELIPFFTIVGAYGVLWFLWTSLTVSRRESVRRNSKIKILSINAVTGSGKEKRPTL